MGFVCHPIAAFPYNHPQVIHIRDPISPLPVICPTQLWHSLRSRTH